MTENLIDDLSGCEASPHNIIVDHFSIGTANELIVREDIRDVSQFTLTDAFHALYNREVYLHENPNPVSAAWWKDFMSSAEATSLRTKTVGNRKAAAQACIALARSLDEYIKIAPPEAGTSEESYKSLRRRLNSVRVAAKESEGEADVAIAIAQSLSEGMAGTVDIKTIEEAERRLKRSATLRRILDIGGAMLRYRRGAKRRKVDGFDRVSSVTTSGDLTRILPTEMMQLAGPAALRLNTMRRLLENQTLAMKKYSLEKAGKGPIVVLVDESGSMYGEPIEQAKGLAYAMAMVAKEQGRWICLVGFGSTYQFNSLVMSPEKWDQLKLFEWLEHFYQGGTDFECLRKTTQRWIGWGVPKGKADLIFVTDAGAYLSEDLVSHFAKWKHDNDVKCYGMAVGCSVDDLPLVCDQTWTTATMGLESNAVREVLTL